MDRNSSQECPVNARVPQGFILGPALFLLYINDLPVYVICNIAIYTDDTTLYSKGYQTFYLWRQLELASELETDPGVEIRENVLTGHKFTNMLSQCLHEAST